MKPWLVNRQRMKPVSTIVLHATEGGTAESSIEFLREAKPDSRQGYSYHAIIERDGEIFKCAPLSRVALHAGVSMGPDGRGVNAYSIGICFANRQNGEPYTFAQLDACAWEVGHCRAMYPGIKWITTHNLISPGRKTDPRGFPIEEFAERVGLPVWRPKLP